MKFLIPMKRDIRQWPPLISLIRGLIELGHEVDHYSYYCSRESLADIASERLKVVTFSEEAYPGKASFFTRARATWNSRQGLKTFLRTSNNYDFVWLGEWDYPDILKILRSNKVDCPVVYQLHEYNPKRFQHCPLVDHVVVPEENRAWMTYFNGHSKRVPLVLPNSPYDHPRVINNQLDPKLNELNAAGKRIVLYQGHMDLKKRCLLEMIRAIALTPEEFVLAILPANLTKDLQQRMEAEARQLGVSERLFFLKSQIAPKHLEVIGQAHIGIGLYRPTSLNQVYCAPNRLYEFTGFGIPVILPNFPGIAQIAAKCPGVLTCDPDSPQSIADTICGLADKDNYGNARQGAEHFFDSCGNYMDSLAKTLESLTDPAIEG